MMTRMPVVRLLFSILFAGHFAAAQEVSSGLTGRVADARGTAVPKASVIAIDLDLYTRSPDDANEKGAHAFPRIQPHVYSLKVEAAAFNGTNPPIFQAPALLVITAKFYF